MALRIKSTFAKLLKVLRIQPRLQLKFQTNQISSTSSQLALWLAVHAFEHAVPSPWKVSIPISPLNSYLSFSMQHKVISSVEPSPTPGQLVIPFCASTAPLASAL